MAEETAYDFAQQHKETVSDHMLPGEFGGEDRGVFLTFSGRLDRRYDWIKSSSKGAMGDLFSSFTDELG